MEERAISRPDRPHTLTWADHGPALDCGRRVAILYGGSIFTCRHGYELAYASSGEDAGNRATRRADGLRA
jgi:hypothetical protein